MGDYILKKGSKILHYSKKFYCTEAQIYSDSLNNIILNSRDITKIFNKLKRHYKIKQLLVFHSNSKKTDASCSKYTIALPPKNCPFHFIVHEVAHAIDFKKRKSRHDKKLFSIVKRVDNYCKKKSYWEKEITTFKKSD